VVVTGSRIRRDPTNTPTPLIQLNREEILQSGEPNVVDFLADIPALTGSIVPEDTTGSNLNDGGLSLLNLRNLGSERTLVLVDGRRHVGASQGDLRVDVDTIPSLLIENVEVVTGGQSALYGADAVSGVVNFILRRNFDGLEIDGALAQINQDGQLNGRLSGLVGRNFLNDRLNVYAFGEYQKSEEVQDLDIDWRREAYTVLVDDVDPSGAEPDGVIDQRLVRGGRNIQRARGGFVALVNQPLPSPAADRDTPIQVCPAPVANLNISTSANCIAIRGDLYANKFFVFNADGTARQANFGTDQAGSGFSRGTVVGGDGVNLGTEQAQGSRLPESTAYRFQTGLNFDITDTIQLFGEAKYVREETYDSGQPTFFNIGIVPLAANAFPNYFAVNVFNIGNDNAFLPANVRAAILANTRPVINAQGVVTNASIADPRGVLTIFGPSRTQTNERDLQRYVVGLRGDRDNLAFINNFSWEAGYTYGKVESTNNEAALDSERFQLASDAVRNAQGQIVCRAQDLIARGQPVRNQNTGVNYTANDPTITGCTPVNLFGSDFRADANADNITGGGGRPGLSQAQAQYLLASVNVDDRNEQHNFLSFASGELWDFWGAGPIGAALGYEYRKEITASSGRDRDTMGRQLFLNTGPAFPEAEYDVNELFAEVRVPLLRDLPFAQDLEVSGAYRTSDYSTVGKVETYSAQGQWRPVRDLMFRSTYGKSVRIPTLDDLFDPGGQTFGNNLNDPCDSVQLALQTGPVGANRRANCIALLGAGYNPDTTRIVYPSGVPGVTGGNPNLAPEESRSYTIGTVITPRFIPRFSLVVDYYDIKISDVISSVTVQQALNNCVSGTTLNTSACGTLFRNGAVPSSPGGVPFGLRNGTGEIGFLQSSLNYAALEAKGIDFQARYSLDLIDVIGRDWGRLDYALRGNYLIRQEDFLNISDPGDATENDSLVGQPRVRTLSTLTYSPRRSISFTWDWDFQTSQELRDSDLFLQDPDSRPAFFIETGEFHQHDFTVRWDVREDITLRAGVVNAFDEEPAPIVAAGQLDSRSLSTLTTGDNFDFFGRRFFIGFKYSR
jgi:outer membrane receptor protein involved in Fe transport